MKGQTHAEARAFWLVQDWSVQDIALAEHLGRAPSAVARWRRLLGKPRAVNYYRHRVGNSTARAFYEALDWTKQDQALARETGLSRERIRQVRLVLGQAQSPNYRKKTFPPSARKSAAVPGTTFRSRRSSVDDLAVSVFQGNRGEPASPAPAGGGRI